MEELTDSKSVESKDGDEAPPPKKSKMDFESFIKDGYQILKKATVASNALPMDRDHDFYQTQESFNKAMKDESDKILGLMNTIMRKYGVKDNIKNRTVDEKTELLIEANDAILERASINLDEMNGIKRTPAESVVIQTVSAQLPVNGSWNRINKATFSVGSSLNSQGNASSPADSVRLLTGKNIIRPQKFFKDVIDNSCKYPWEPKIKEKPNSIAPLAIFLERTENGEEFSHPYMVELEKFTPPAEQLTKVDVVQPKPLSETPLHEISTPEALNELVEELRKHSEFAVDLEHHSYRTFMGITCLMQISTKDADYIIDTLALRDKLCILNEVFTKPTIVKIFHGADYDVQWLQRDLSLYVVNMFDTYRAAKQLTYSELSLAYLLRRFCHFMPNKQYQLADWRIRPLPEELKTYAREDTHYLIYIYHMLRNELLKAGNGKDNVLKSVVDASTEVCKKRYFKPILTEESHLEFYRKCRKMFDNRQMYALKGLYHWRDAIAREEDESPGYVLPKHMLLQIAESLPKEMQGILACCNPIPPMVRANLLELHEIILKAREQSLEKPIMKEETRSKGCTQQISKINIDSPLYCPHDLTRTAEFRDDLPTLLGKSDVAEKENQMKEETYQKVNVQTSIETSKAQMSIFNKADTSEDEEETNEKLKSLKFLSPYERYKLVKPYLQAEATKAAKEAEENKKRNEDDPTDEDRIASLHEHFVKVVNEVREMKSDDVPNEDVNVTSQPGEPTYRFEPARSLVEMGGRKRRHESADRSNEGEGGDFPTGTHTYFQEFESPLPRSFYARRKKFLRDNWKATEGETNDGQQQKKKKFKKNPEGGNKQTPKKKNKKKKGGNWQHNADGGQSVSKNGGQGRPQDVKREFKKSPDHKNDFKPFDFTSVDYKKFQGGAKAVDTGTQFKSSFRGKGNNKRRGGGKQNNKSQTFNGKNKK